LTQLLHSPFEFSFVNVLKDIFFPGAKFFFTEAGQLALTAKSSATIAELTILLDFHSHPTLVVSAGEQPGKGEIVLPVLGFVVSPENSLNLLANLAPSLVFKIFRTPLSEGSLEA
jgi:hypothetical protein